jgi:hypothetical protein
VGRTFKEKEPGLNDFDNSQSFQVAKTAKSQKWVPKV